MRVWYFDIVMHCAVVAEQPTSASSFLGKHMVPFSLCSQINPCLETRLEKRLLTWKYVGFFVFVFLFAR